MTFVLIGVRAFFLEGSTTKIKDIHSFQVYRYIPRSEMVWSSEAENDLRHRTADDGNQKLKSGKLNSPVEGTVVEIPRYFRLVSKKNASQVVWFLNHQQYDTCMYIFPVTGVQSSKDPTKNRVREANWGKWFGVFSAIHRGCNSIYNCFCSSIPNFPGFLEILTEFTDLPKKNDQQPTKASQNSATSWPLGFPTPLG